MIVAHPAPAERRHDAQFFQRRQHRRAFHRAALIRLQHNRATRHTYIPALNDGFYAQIRQTPRGKLTMTLSKNKMASELAKQNGISE